MRIGLRQNLIYGASRQAAVTGVSTLALSLFFTSATAASGTVTDTEGTGNTLTFTRASVAKYWDGDGVLQEAASGIARVGASNRKPVTNLLSYPEQFDNANWVNIASSESSGQSDPFGGTNAFKLVEDSASGTRHSIHNNANQNSIAGKANTISVYAKAVERSLLQIRVFNVGAGVAYATYNVSTGVVVASGGSALNGTGIAEVTGATGWYRIWMTHSSSSAAGVEFVLSNSATTENPLYTGDGSSGLYIFGAQLNEGDIEDYVGATSLSGANDKAVGSWAQLGDTDSVTSNSAVAPDGTTTADTLADNNATGSQFVERAINVILPAAGTYNYSCFVKANGLARAIIAAKLYDADTYADVNLSTGATSGTASNIIATYYGNGWYRVSMTFSTTTDLNGFLSVGPTQNGTNTQVDSDGTSSIYVWGHQVTSGSTLYPYVGMPQTGFTKQGYLAEAAATNLLDYSEEFDNAAWTKGNTAITANAVVAVDGTTTADKFTENTTSNVFFTMGDGFSASTGVSYTLSFFAKAEERNWIRAQFDTGGAFSTADRSAFFDLATGTVGTVAASTTAGIIPVGNGWYRCWISAAATGTAAANLQFLLSTDGTTIQYAGTVGSGVYLWGAQVETDTYPSSYIKTSGGTAARAADDDNLIDVLFGVDAGTLVYEGTPANSVTAATDRVSLNDGTASEVVKFVDDASGNIDFDVTDGGAAQASIDTGVNAGVGQRRRVAGAFAANDFAASANGLAAVTDAAGTVPTLTRMDLGRGFHKSVQFYSERKSDADLATLSTITDDGTAWRDEKDAA